MIKIGPSIMCADMGNLEKTIKILNQPDVHFFHFDIMDGSFVPNFSMGPDIIKNLRPHTQKPFDVHLMVQNPERFVTMFKNAGADMLSIHVEATTHLQRTLETIKKSGMQAGVALNPATPIHVLEYIWDVIDYVLIMTVNPGFAGQKFIPLVLEKIKEVKYLFARKGVNIPIQVDGNISFETIPQVIEKGAELLVCGTSSLFLKDKPLDISLKELVEFINGLVVS